MTGVSESLRILRRLRCRTTLSVQPSADTKSKVSRGEFIEGSRPVPHKGIGVDLDELTNLSLSCHPPSFHSERGVKSSTSFPTTPWTHRSRRRGTAVSRSGIRSRPNCPDSYFYRRLFMIYSFRKL